MTVTPSGAPVTSVVLAGGGTAGHVNPLLAVADELRARNPEAKILVLGTATGLEADLVPARGYELRPIPRVPLPRRPSVDLLRLPGRLSAAIKAAEAAIDEVDAQVVVGFGGYVSTPAYLAARRRGVPVVIHEQNARPGIANRLGARWATQVGLTFPGTALKPADRDAVVTGLPLRREIAALVEAREADPVAARVAAADALGLDASLATVLVTGGSLGALSLNTAVAGAAETLLTVGAQVLHLTGKGKDGPVRDAVLRLPPHLVDAQRYHVREYLPEMHHALGVADLVIARSGAGAVSELAALGLPAVYVPLPIGNGEQRLNATPLVAAGGGLIVDDADLTPEWVAEHVPALLADPARLDAMAAAALGTGVRDAAARVADLIEAAAKEGRA